MEAAVGIRSKLWTCALYYHLGKLLVFRLQFYCYISYTAYEQFLVLKSQGGYSKNKVIITLKKKITLAIAYGRCNESGIHRICSYARSPWNRLPI